MFNVQSPRTDDAGIEQEIQAKGLTAPRVTPADIEANIASEHYFTAADGEQGALMNDGKQPAGFPSNEALCLLTFCVLVLRNGFTVTGESACASPENFDAELGRKIARANAVNKVWPLMGYELRSKLAGRADAAAPATPSNLQPFQQRVVDEKDELDTRLDKLRAFVDSPLFDSLGMSDRAMMTAQAEVMSKYSRILGDRIAAFK